VTDELLLWARAFALFVGVMLALYARDAGMRALERASGPSRAMDA
jgi:hypothetical protein